MAGRETPKLGCQAELRTLRCAGSPPAAGAEHAQQERAARGSSRSRPRAGASASLGRGRAFRGARCSFDQLLMSFDRRDLLEASMGRNKRLYSGSKKLRIQRGVFKSHLRVSEARSGCRSP